MAPKDTHKWEQLEPGSPYYRCTECRCSGKKIGNAWPPIRDPKYILYPTCAGKKEAEVAAYLKSQGVE